MVTLEKLRKHINAKTNMLEEESIAFKMWRKNELWHSHAAESSWKKVDKD